MKEQIEKLLSKLNNEINQMVLETHDLSQDISSKQKRIEELEKFLISKISARNALSEIINIPDVPGPIENGKEIKASEVDSN